MTAKHPSFIFKRHEGTSYLFRSMFPNDLRELCRFPRELTISLKTGIKTEAIRLASILKIQLDGIFTDIRSGNITETCVTSIKNQLKVLLLKNKLSIGGVDNNSFNDNAYTLETFLQFQAQYKSQPSLMKLTSNHKLVRAYVSRFVLEDIFSFCDQHDIDYNVSDFPRKHIRRAREIFFNLICRDIGLDTFAEQMATEVLKIHLESIEYKDFVKFLKSYKAAKEEIHVLLEESEHLDHGELIQAIGEFYQISEIALKLGIDVLFSDSPDEIQTIDSNIKIDYQEKDVWIALKSKSANAPSKDAGSKISLNKRPTIDVQKATSESS